jgi:esterase/lipase
MKRTLILIGFIIAVINLSAYIIGQYTKTFFDASRTRNIQTVIFYPIDENNPDAVFPYIVFGHGWLVNYTFTQTLTDNLVNLGWIVAHPRTEEGVFPSHEQFALDLVYLRGAVLMENSASGSPLFNSVDTLALVMGYSMGGGCAILAAATDPGYDSIVTFAAAETDVSAIAAAANVTIPSVTFSGSADTVAPPASHQIPIYNNLDSNYKSFVSINGAGHLNLFSNALIPEILNPWLSYLKTGDIGFIGAYEAALADNSSSLTYQIENNLVIGNDDITSLQSLVNLSSYPNPIHDYTRLIFSLQAEYNTEISIYNIKGQLIRSLYNSKLDKGSHEFSWDCRSDSGSKVSSGLYLIGLKLNGTRIPVKRVIVTG